MESDTILLLDFDSTNSLSARVQEVLAPAISKGLHFRRESVSSYDVELRDAELGSILARVNPNLVFLVLPAPAG